jgi:hypothetical protein
MTESARRRRFWCDVSKPPDGDAGLAAEAEAATDDRGDDEDDGDEGDDVVAGNARENTS